jgi:hypothetical protein
VAAITQQRPAGVFSGSRYGSFAGKTNDPGSGHPVGILTQQRPPGVFGGRRYASFAGKTPSAGGGATDEQFVADHTIPLAWFADVGFAAAYAFDPVGIQVANRDDVSAPVGSHPVGILTQQRPVGVFSGRRYGSFAGRGEAEPPVVEEGSRQTAAGRSKRKRQRAVVEIDGREVVVESVEEAQALVEQLKADAEKAAQQALERAANVQKRPQRKVLQDARKALALPSIEVRGDDMVADLMRSAVRDVESLYQSTLQSIEIGALMRRHQQQEEDDEDVLLLLL